MKTVDNQRESLDDQNMEITGASDPGTVKQIPTPKNCFVCCGVTGRILRSGGRSELNNDGYSFFFKELLEIPEIQSIKYLTQLVTPESWIGLCRSCKLLIVQGSKLKVQINQLQVQVEQCQRRILEKMKQTIEVPRAEVDNPNHYICSRVLFEIQDYVTSKRYSVLNEKRDSPDEPSQKNQKISTRAALAVSVCYNDPFSTSASHDDDVHHDHSCNNEEISDSPIKASSIASPSIISPIQSFCTAEENNVKYKRAPRQRKRKLIVPKKERKKRRKGTDKPFARYLYDCPNCPQIKGYSVPKFMQHLAIHQRRPYKCTICLELHHADEQLQEQHWKERHTKVDHPPDRDKFVKIKFEAGQIWKCERCLKGFFSEEDRDQHELNCLSQIQLRKRRKLPDSTLKPFSCQTCQVSFRHFSELRFHRGLQHPDVDRMSCYYCDDFFGEKTVEGVEARNEKKMMDHLNRKHIGQGFCKARIFLECPPCGIVFDTEEMYKKHFHQKHGIHPTRSLSCVICQKTYSAVLERRKHMNLHHFHSDASHCDICGKTFVKKTYLAHHKLLHHGIEPEDFPVLSCSATGCNYRAACTEALSSHNYRTHKVSDTPNHICSYCGKGFKGLKSRKDHEEIHINKDSRPYQCDQCGSSFAVPKYLYIHKRLSHEGRNFPCNMKKKQSDSSTVARKLKKLKKA